MSVSFNAQADRMTGTISLGPVTGWTVTCWVKLASNLGRAAVPWMVHDGAGTNYLRLSFYDGLQATFQTAGSTWFQLFGLTATVDTWYYIGISAQTSGMALLAHRADGSSTWGGNEEYPQDDPVTITADAVTIGASWFSNQYMDGSMCCVRMYEAALTREEIMSESWSNSPRRTAGLRAWYPFLTADGTDYSGNGHTLAIGTATTDTGIGPALPWGQGRRRIVVVNDAPPVEGSIGAAFPAVTASLAAEIQVAGQAAAPLPALTGGLAGDVASPGLLNGILPAVTGGFQGELTGGFLVGDLPALTGEFDGALRVDGQLDAALPAFTGALAGGVDIPPNDLTFTVGPPRRGWAARGPAAAWTADPATGAGWRARGLAAAWTSGAPGRAWKARQPTT
jgi:hypothetical protein